MIDCNLLGSLAEGSTAVMILNGVGNVVGVPETVTQSPSVVKAEVTAYAVIMRYFPGLSGLFKSRYSLNLPLCAVSK